MPTLKIRWKQVEGCPLRTDEEMDEKSKSAEQTLQKETPRFITTQEGESLIALQPLIDCVH